jgi:6-pyruvoyltetrahydropterin/6-carboxytetrahydropterin synthase
LYKLNVTAAFSAAHRLDGYPGACKRLHGHNWKVRIGVVCEELDSIGMAVDFKALRELLNGLLDEMDHQYLNELPAFANCNPTSEHIARYIYEQMRGRLPNGAQMTEVEIAESDNSSVVYGESCRQR